MEKARLVYAKTVVQGELTRFFSYNLCYCVVSIITYVRRKQLPSLRLVLDLLFPFQISTYY